MDRTVEGLAEFKTIENEISDLFKQKEQFDPSFAESCVDFEVAHLSTLMVRDCHTGDSYLN